jgi:hypothetical protein
LTPARRKEQAAFSFKEIRFDENKAGCGLLKNFPVRQDAYLAWPSIA